MKNMGRLQERLFGGLWHTTHPCRLEAIVSAGFLTAEPNIPNSERWKASAPEYYPFVRHIGGVSLFDFKDFEPESYEEKYPLSNWYSFVPYLKSWAGAVWIEIKRASVREKFISANELVDRWKADKDHRHTIMPGIEAAVIGNISISAFGSVFFTWNNGSSIHDVDIFEPNLFNFNAALSVWKATEKKST